MTSSISNKTGVIRLLKGLERRETAFRNEVSVRLPVFLQRLHNRVFVSWVNPQGMDCILVGPQHKCLCRHKYTISLSGRKSDLCVLIKLDLLSTRPIWLKFLLNDRFSFPVDKLVVVVCPSNTWQMRRGPAIRTVAANILWTIMQQSRRTNVKKVLS